MATLTTSGVAVIKAGANVAAQAESVWNGYIEEAEGVLTALMQTDVVGQWPTISGVATCGPMLSEYVARSAAVQGVQYNMSGYATDEGAARIHGEDIINIHLFRMGVIENLLKEGSVLKQIGVS